MFLSKIGKNATKAVLKIESERLNLQILHPSAASAVTEYLIRNRDFHRPFHQKQDDTYFTVAEQREYLKSDVDRYFLDMQYGFWLSYHDHPDYIVGRLSFASVVRGGLCSCLMGYHLDKSEVGKGLMREAIGAGCKYMFEVKGLHRIQADIMPNNLRSIQTVEHCHFKKQGLNEKYMCINGQWQDHYCYALINEPEWQL